MLPDTRHKHSFFESQGCPLDPQRPLNTTVFEVLHAHSGPNPQPSRHPQLQRASEWCPAMPAKSNHIGGAFLRPARPPSWPCPHPARTLFQGLPVMIGPTYDDIAGFLIDIYAAIPVFSAEFEILRRGTEA
jgi:hypothetical protein